MPNVSLGWVPSSGSSSHRTETEQGHLATPIRVLSTCTRGTGVNRRLRYRAYPPRLLESVEIGVCKPVVRDSRCVLVSLSWFALPGPSTARHRQHRIDILVAIGTRV